jgi:lipid-binding SYLF domain-containing protein
MYLLDNDVALQVGEGPDKSIPEAVLDGAKGLAILTVLKVGLMVTYKMGTGLVVARKSDGTWSAPSAIASCGLGWGAQVCSSHISLQYGSLLSCSCFS